MGSLCPIQTHPTRVSFFANRYFKCIFVPPKCCSVWQLGSRQTCSCYLFSFRCCLFVCRCSRSDLSLALEDCMVALDLFLRNEFEQAQARLKSRYENNLNHELITAVLSSDPPGIVLLRDKQLIICMQATVFYRYFCTRRC